MLRSMLLTGSLVASVSLASLLPVESGVTGQLVVAGHGAERATVERLARASEKGNPGAAVTIRWDRILKTVDMVRSGQARLSRHDPEGCPATMGLSFRGTRRRSTASAPVMYSTDSAMTVSA